MFRVSDYPKKISIGLYEKECNLKCPKCLVHSPYMKRGREIKGNLGSMPIKSVLKIFDEIKDYKPMVGSSFWSEPLFRKDLFKKFFIEAKRRGLPTQTSTNGLLLTEELADFMVNHLDIITISIDAFTKETLLKTRGTDKLNVIRNAVLLLLKKRESLYPRITVNFTSEESNAHEKETFLKFWMQHVDAVRVNEAYSSKKKINKKKSTKDRRPCRELYDNMIIDYNGDVRICCLDAYRETNLGNVLRGNVQNIWLGNKFAEIRKIHEEGEYSKLPFCATCDQWAGFNIVKEKVVENVLIRSTDFSVYYNRIDRLNNWKKETKRIDVDFV